MWIHVSSVKERSGCRGVSHPGVMRLLRNPADQGHRIKQRKWTTHCFLTTGWRWPEHPRLQRACVAEVVRRGIGLFRLHPGLRSLGSDPTKGKAQVHYDRGKRNEGLTCFGVLCCSHWKDKLFATLTKESIGWDRALLSQTRLCAAVADFAHLWPKKTPLPLSYSWILADRALLHNFRSESFTRSNLHWRPHDKLSTGNFFHWPAAHSPILPLALAPNSLSSSTSTLLWNPQQQTKLSSIASFRAVASHRFGPGRGGLRPPKLKPAFSIIADDVVRSLASREREVCFSCNRQWRHCDIREFIFQRVATSLSFFHRSTITWLQKKSSCCKCSRTDTRTRRTSFSRSSSWRDWRDDYLRVHRLACVTVPVKKTFPD